MSLQMYSLYRDPEGKDVFPSSFCGTTISEVEKAMCFKMNELNASLKVTQV